MNVGTITQSLSSIARAVSSAVVSSVQWLGHQVSVLVGFAYNLATGAVTKSVGLIQGLWTSTSPLRVQLGSVLMSNWGILAVTGAISVFAAIKWGQTTDKTQRCVLAAVAVLAGLAAVGAAGAVGYHLLVV